MTQQPDHHVPDDLSGLAEPPQTRAIGNIDPALTAWMDQTMQKLQPVFGQLVALTVTASSLDPTDPEHHPAIQDCAAKSSQLVNDLDPDEKSVLINMLTVALVDSYAYLEVGEVRARFAANEGDAELEPTPPSQPA